MCLVDGIDRTSLLIDHLIGYGGEARRESSSSGPCLSMAVDDTGSVRAGGEGDEVNFGQDKCEVYLLYLGLSRSFRAGRVKTKGHFKKMIQKHS